MIEPGTSPTHLVQETIKDGILESFTRYVEKMDVHLYYEDHDNVPFMIVNDYIQEHPHSVIPIELKPAMIRIAQKLLNSF